MVDADISDYISGGYYLVKPTARKDWSSSELLPETLISLSFHISTVFNIFWGMNPGDSEKALKFGIPEKLFNEFRQYNDYDEGYPYAFARIETLRKFMQRFLPSLSDDTLLIGAGLHKDQVKQYWTGDDLEKTPQIGQTVKLALPLAAGGQPIGFDVVGQDYGMGCSWLCNYLERDMHQLFGIRTNEQGLLKSYAEAKQICDWIEADENRNRAEPIPYDPWLLLSYPLSIDS